MSPLRLARLAFVALLALTLQPARAFETQATAA